MNTKMTKAELMEELKTAHQRIAELERVSVPAGGEALFSRVFQVSPSLMALSEIGTGKYVEVNEAFLNTLGYTHEEVICKTSTELNLFVDPNQRTILLERLQEQGYLRDEFVSVCTKAGDIRYGILTGELIQVQEQKLALIAMNDITNRKQAEDGMYLAGSRYRALIENAPDGIVLIGTDFKFKYASPSAVKIFGYDLNTDLDLSPDALTHPDDLPMVLAVLSDLIEHPERTPTIQYRFLRKDGDWRWIESTFSNLLALPSVEAIVINFLDITERKQAEIISNEREATLRKAQQVAHVGSWAWHIPNNHLEWSDEMFHIFGIDKETFSGDLTEVIGHAIHPEDRAAVEQANLAVEQDGRPKPLEYRIVWKDGSVRTVWAEAGEMILDDAGQPLKLTGIVQDITERKKSENALRASEENYRKLAETSDSAIAVIDREGRILYANPIGLRVWEEPQLVGKTIHDLFPKEIADGYLAVVRRVIDEQVTDTNELEITIKGRLMWFHANMSPLKNSDGSADTLLLNAMDITERKLAEDALKMSERVLRLFVEHSPASIAMFDRDMKYIVASRRYLKDYGLGEQDLTGRSHYEVFPEITDSWKQIHQRCLNGTIERAEADPFLRADGKTDWIYWEIHPWYEESGTVGGIILFSEVITERIAAQEQLRESEEKYRVLIDSTSDGVFVAQNEHFVFYNAAFPALLGYTFEEFMNMPFEKVIVPEHLNLWTTRFHQRVAGQNVISNYQVQFMDKTGTKKIWIDLRANLINYGGQPAVLGIARDITDQKQILEQIESLAKFPAENPGPIVRIDLSGKLLYANEASFAYLTEWSLEVGKQAPTVMLNVAAIVLETGRDKTIETIHKDRVITLDFILLQQGGYINVYGKDITDQRRAEKNVRALQQFSQSTIDALSSHLCVLDETGVILSVNAAWRAFADANPPIPLNYGVGENYLAICDNAQGGKADEAHEVAAGLRAVLNGETAEYHFEYACHSPKEQRWFFLQAQRFESQGSPRLVISHENITERKQIESERAQLTERLNLATYAARLGIWDWDIQKGQLVWDDRTYAMYGIKAGESGGAHKAWLNGVHPDDREACDQAEAQAVRGEAKYDIEFRVVWPDGTIHWLKSKGEVFRDENGTALRMVGVNYDITESKRAQIDLAEAQRVAKLGNWHYDIPSNTITWSDELYRIFDVDKTEFGGLYESFLSHIHPDDRERVMAVNQYAQTSGESFNVEYRIVKRDAVEVYIRESGYALRDSAGQVTGLFGIAQDVTEQVEAAARIYESETRFRQIAETIPEMFWIFDHAQQSLVYISPAYENIWGYAVKNLYEGSRLYIESVHPDDRGIMSAVLERQARGEATETQYRIVQLDGSVRWIHDRSFPVFDEVKGTVLRTIGIAADITERRQVGEALRDNEERLRLSLSAAKQGLYDLNVQTGEAVVNGEYAEMLGYDPETFVETNQAWTERLHPDDAEIASRAYVNYISGLIPEYRVEFRQRTKDGKWKWILSLGRLVEYDASGKPLRLLGTHTDITDRKQAEIQLQKRASQLALINDVSREIAGVLDIQAVLDLSARLLSKEFDYHHVGLFTLENGTGELVMRSKAGEYLDFFPENHRIKLGDGVVGSVGLSGQMILANQVQNDPHYRNFYPQVIPTQSELSLPIKIAGAVVGVLDIQSPQPNAFSEEDIKVLSTLVDQVAVAIENARLYGAVQKELADRKQAEEKSRMLTIALESAANGVIITDVRGNIQWVNPAWSKLTGYSFEEAVGQNPNIVRSDVHSKDFYRVLWQTISSGKIWNGEIFNKRKDGTYFTEETTIAPVRDENGKIINYIGVKQDVTGRKQLESERQKLIRDLGERVKELTALHQASRLFQNTTLSEHETLQALVEILPTAWQHSEITAARVTVDDKEYSTPGFIETPWMQKTVVNVPGNRKAVIEVAYLEERPAEDEGPFLKEERQLIEMLAEKMQSALARQSMERDLRKRTEDLANLVEAGRALSETLDPTRIYPLIYNYIVNAMPCDFLMLSSFDPQTELIKCEYMHSVEGPQDVANFPLIPLEPPGRGTQSLVIRSGESMLLPDYDTALKTATTTVHFNDKAEIVEASPDDEERTRSAIIVPLKVNGVVAGVLQVFSMKMNAHTQDHLRFVEALAFHASAALSNAKLFSELEERVRQRTVEVQDLYDNAPAGYHSLDIHGNITLINQTELDWLGYTREEVVGRNFSYFLTPESLGKFQEIFPIFKYRGSLNALEMNFRRKDGSIFPVLVNAIAVKDEYGNYLMSRSTVFDNTERRNAELALLEREEIYRALFESANDAIFMISPDGLILRANPRCEDLLGYTADELIGHMSGEFIAHSDEDDAGNIAARLLTGEQLPVYDRHFLRKDGSLVDTEVNLSLIRDEAGRPKFIQSVVRDISARKRAENALRESEEQNRLLFEESPEAVMLFDQNGRLVRTNRAFNSLIGAESGEFIGHLITEIGLLPQDLMNSLALSTNAAFDRHDRFAELEFKLKDVKGEFRDINTRIFPLDLQGQRHYLASIHDITTSKRAEETLRLANAEMERALRLKDEFLANMSHELRTPLNAVLGISESLLEQISGPLNPKQQKYLQTVLESAQHLLALINDILDLAKVNAGRIELDINKADVIGVAHASMRMIKELAQKKEINVTLKIAPTIKMAWLDERRLKQMLVNLLSNAVKFTPKGGRIGLDIQSDQDNKTLFFIIWDTGIGINEDDQRLLFQPFVQLDAGLARGSQGTGLGLVLVKQMARLHNGNVTVESEPGKGSRFIISLPWVSATDTDVYTRHAITPPAILQEARPAPIPVRDDAPLILLVDDTEAVTLLIHDYLQQHGYHVVTANDGFEGIARVKEKIPDLILMDVMMPELDGLETTQRIRKDMGLVDVPIIALTALAMAGDRERCLAVGMNDYISKPVILKELLNTVEHYLNLSKEGSQ